MPIHHQLLLLVLWFTWCSAVQAGDIYKCQVNGVTTFVDSPNRCGEGGAQQVQTTKKAPVAPTAVPAPASPVPPAPPALNTTPARAPVAPVADPRVPSPTPAVATSSCQKLAQDPSRFRECTRTERRKEVNRIATGRLAAASVAVSEYIAFARKTNSMLAVDKAGRGATWCEQMLSDVMALKNLEVVDDESTPGPRWLQSHNDPGPTAVEILDPNYTEWQVAGGKVVNGNVTVRWRKSNLVLLRVVGVCSEHNGAIRCSEMRYMSIEVHEDNKPYACNLQIVSPQYWPKWKDSLVQVFTGR
jgi:hypothetical protein